MRVRRATFAVLNWQRQAFDSHPRRLEIVAGKVVEHFALMSELKTLIEIIPQLSFKPLIGFA